MQSSWIALFVLEFLTDFGNCATTEYTVHIGTQATIVGYEYDAPKPPGRVFAGIPYAQPMTSTNRFMPTQRKDPSGQINAFHFGSECMQPSGSTTVGSEDCLFLNIFTPKVDNMPQQKYPVYIFIHGGGYSHSSGNMNAAEEFKNLISHGVIVVSINYRLNVFGFFSTRDSVIPGNMGLMDQIEAINWVKRYISYFGGDPNMITIGGQSAGAMSVSLHTMSPISQHLFQRAILASGSAFSTGHFSATEQSNSDSKNLAVKLGCITAANWDKHDLVQMVLMKRCLQTKSAQEIQNAGGFFIPVIDGPGGVIPDRLEVLAARRPPIPMLMGNDHDEHFGSIAKAGGVLSNESTTYLNGFTRQAEAHKVQRNNFLQYYNNSRLVANAMQTAYIDSSNLDDQDHIGWAKVFVQMLTELEFIGPTHRDVMWARQTNSPVYLYSFDYLAPGAYPTLDPRLRDSAITHGWESQYIYGEPGHEGGGWQITRDDTDTQNFFDTYWTNFIKYGNPTPAPATLVWPQLGSNMEYMKLGPRPTPSTDFHPKSKFFACDVPAIEGIHQSWCT